MRLAFLALLSLSLGLPVGAAAQPEPGAYELEVWRAAGRLDVAAGYQNYLDKFPNGAFATLARLALQKLGGAAPAAAAPDAGPARTLAPAASETGAYDGRVGDRLVGPGVVTVGSLGTRRQLIVPAGTWMLLAAYDHRSTHAQPVKLTTLALGQFAGGRMRSLLTTTFNRQPINMPGVPTSSAVALGLAPRWALAEDCEAGASQALYRDSTTQSRVRYCATVRALRGTDGGAIDAVELQPRLNAALAQLDTALPAFHLRSDMHMTDARFGYVGYSRFDCADAACGAGVADERVAWLRAFVPLALAGQNRDLEVEDLLPGKPDGSPGRLVLPP